MSTTYFTDDFKTTPYWWDATPRPDLGTPELPRAIDVAIIGSGYTGLCAALQTARGGRETVVFDARDVGWGCSARNGGQISTSVKPDFDHLARKHGPDAALAILTEGDNALAWIKNFVAEELIDCAFDVPGRFHAAHSPAQYDILAREIANQPKSLEKPTHIVPRAEQYSELGTDAYFGGAVMESHASLDPARYHQGLLERVLAADVTVIPNCAVIALSRAGNGFDLTTARGMVRARDVVVATNGYTGRLTPWLRRRVIPIGSYMIATEPLEASVMDELMPRNRVVSDTRKVVYYYRPSPDRSRIVFGGRVTSGETDPRHSGELLRRDLAGIFPGLAGVRISHSWLGFVAYSFDELAHIGKQNGIYYAMGYCGSGVSMASYLGTRTGQKILGLKEGSTGFDDISFQTRPLYTGVPWFLAASVAYYRWRDGTAA